MSEKSKPQSISRRNFLKGFGTGLVGSSLLLPRIGTAQQVDNEKMKEFLRNGEPISLKVNGTQVRAIVEPRTTLASLLRNQLQMTGTKIVCNNGRCGGCTVVMDGKAIYSCHTLAMDADGREIVTVEGLVNQEQLHPVQQAFVDEDGMQCGFCTPGQVMSAYALLLEYKKPTVEQIKRGMSGNLCRCAAYPEILQS
ncbi:MAG TPA: (2Fe-2S)-binding protein, partial [bacterium]|nr:(2Fe-2S)-binding protein [bacterium]